jgi:hypothetical protein
MQAVIDRLLASEEPSIRLKVRAGVLGEDAASPELHRLRSEIRRSPRARALLASRDDGPLSPGEAERAAEWARSLALEARHYLP